MIMVWPGLVYFELLNTYLNPCICLFYSCSHIFRRGLKSSYTDRSVKHFQVLAATCCHYDHSIFRKCIACNTHEVIYYYYDMDKILIPDLIQMFYLFFNSSRQNSISHCAKCPKRGVRSLFKRWWLEKLLLPYFSKHIDYCK